MTTNQRYAAGFGTFGRKRRFDEMLSSADIDALRRQLLDMSEKLRVASRRINPNLWAETPGQEAVKRALVVAAVGGHTVCIIGPESSAMTALADQVGVASAAEPSPDATLSPSKARAAADRWLKRMRRFTMMVEAPLTPERYRQNPRMRGMTLEQAEEQIKHARAVKVGDGMEESAAVLLRQAVSELGFDSEQRDAIVSVAKSIAALDGRTDISVAAIAEAVQYRLDRKR